MKPSAGLNVSSILLLKLPPFVNASASALNTSEGKLQTLP
jgi:hypothetical protein